MESSRRSSSRLALDPEIKKSLWIYPELIKLAFIFIFVTDPSLSIVEHLGIVPYGRLWVWLNIPSFFIPLSNGTPLSYQGFNLLEFQYKAYLFLLDLPVTYLIFKKLGSKMFLFSQIWACWSFMGFFQNVTIYWLLILGAWNPLFTGLAILAKLPIGWSFPFDWNNPHVRCALYCGGKGDLAWQFFTERTLIKVVSYSSLMLWAVIGPSYYVLKRRSKNLKARRSKP